MRKVKMRKEDKIKALSFPIQRCRARRGSHVTRIDCSEAMKHIRSMGMNMRAVNHAGQRKRLKAKRAGQ